MQYIVRKLLNDSHFPNNPLEESHKKLLKRTHFTRDSLSGKIPDLRLGSSFFLNVKNQLVRRGDFQPTPEARLAKDHQGSFGVLNVQALEPGTAQLYLYTQNLKESRGDSVPSKIPFSKFKSISGWLDLLVEILRVIDGWVKYLNEYNLVLYKPLFGELRNEPNRYNRRTNKY